MISVYNTNGFVINRFKGISSITNTNSYKILNSNKLNRNIKLNSISVSLDNSIVPSTGVKLQKATLLIFITYLAYKLLNTMIQGNIIINCSNNINNHFLKENLVYGLKGRHLKF